MRVHQNCRLGAFLVIFDGLLDHRQLIGQVRVLQQDAATCQQAVHHGSLSGHSTATALVQLVDMWLGAAEETHLAATLFLT